MTDTDTQRLDLDALVAKWQPILRLQDWDFVIKYQRASQFSDPVPAGSCWFLIKKRHCHIRILDPIDFGTDFSPPMDIELTVVHEMLHPFIATFCKAVQNAQMEQFIHAMSSALVGLHRAADDVRS